MKLMSQICLFLGVAIIGLAGWSWYRASLDPNDLVVVSWPVPTDAKAGTDTVTKIQITNNGYGEARVVGINHC